MMMSTAILPAARVLGLCVATLFFGNCSPQTDYQRAIYSGRTTIPWVAAFEKVYPGANNFITYYNIKGGDRVWNSEAFLYDRYTVTMQIPDVRFDASDRQVVGWGTPKFFVVETTKVHDTGGLSSTDQGEGMQFGPDQWKKLEAAKGDLTVLGIRVNKAPVPDFDFVKKQNRH